MGNPHLAAEPILCAKTRPRLAPSKPSAPLVRLGRALIPAYLKLALAFERVIILSPDEILSELRDFQEHRSRLLVAFRHPYGDEPQLMFHVFENMLPKLAKNAGTPLARRPGLRLLHDYAVPLWGNAFIRYILPRSGAMPVYHVKCDTGGLSDIRAALRDGENPIGLAPEGQISYHSETLPRIEQGSVRMGFWCASDLEKAGRSEEMRLLPISVHYHYDQRDFHKIASSIEKLESALGIPSQRQAAQPLQALVPRIVEIERNLLAQTETYYRDSYGYVPPQRDENESEPTQWQKRWHALLPAALSVAEHMLGIDPGQEDLTQRMYRVRLEGWARVFPETAMKQLPPLARALADRRAGEGWFAMRHMELVDLMSYHDVQYLEKTLAPSDDKIVESVLNLLDLYHRLMGGNITNRPNNIRKTAYIVPGKTLNLTQHLKDYRANPKQTARLVTQTLSQNLVDCIERYHHETNL